MGNKVFLTGFVSQLRKMTFEIIAKGQVTFDEKVIGFDLVD
jgi:hypothetical protein